MPCPCGTSLELSACCAPYIEGRARPETAEQLMRSRYTAYTQADVNYLEKTLAPESRPDFDRDEARRWALQSKWKGLKVLRTEGGTASDETGVVEFVATYVQGGKGVDHHEVSQFRKAKNGQWLFIDGDSHTHAEGEGHQHHHHVKVETHRRLEPKIGRNDPCSCGSGAKYKKCCGAVA